MNCLKTRIIAHHAGAIYLLNAQGNRRKRLLNKRILTRKNPVPSPTFELS